MKQNPILLRNGTLTLDSRLTRIQQFDPRSRNYPVTATIAANKKPRSYTWGCSTHLDQGSDGACTGAAFTHELIAKPSVVKNVDMTFAKEQVYWEAQRTDSWPGGSYPGASPFYEGSSVLAAAQVVKKLGYIREYRWAFGLHDLIMAVGYRGPAVLGVDWYSDMYDTDKDGFISATGQFTGGHAILCKGVNLKGEYFVLHNSWGPTWGNKGDAKISFADMDFLLQSQGEACVPVTRAPVSLFQDIVDSIKSAFSFSSQTK
jgi:hypothetical protein